MKRWKILNNQIPNPQNIVDLLLTNRGVSTTTDKDAFLNPPSIQQALKQFSKEFIQSLSQASKLIQQAITNQTPIVIYGDYDADGISATTILYSVIKNELNYQKLTAFIPNRFEHGYGLSTGALDTILVDLKTNFPTDDTYLMITVDTGITAVEPIAYAKSKGFDVIITDHHQKPSILPDAKCIVWNDEIVASSIAWVLSRVLGSKDPRSVAYAALATVTDVQPVLNFNRSIIRDGLNILNSNPPVGLKALMTVADIQRDVTTYHLGWVLGPRLNATGRILDASAALKLLQAATFDDAMTYARQLNQLNTQRQDKTLEMFNLVGTYDDSNLPKIIFTESEQYHEGIIGLVASRLVKSYYRPSIVICLTDGQGKGSVRSVSGVNIIEMLRQFDYLFESLGGHPMAAGFSIKTQNIPQLKEKLLELAQTAISDELLVPEIEADLNLPLQIINLDLTSELNKLKPFGIGNPEPVFCSTSIGVVGFNTMGRDKTHLSLQLMDGISTYKGVYFGGAALADQLHIGAKIDILYTLSENTFNGRTSVDLLLKDLRLC